MRRGRVVGARGPELGRQGPSAARRHIRLDGIAKYAFEIGRNRLFIMAALFAVAFLAIAGKLVHVVIFQSGNEPRLARAPQSPTIETGRADIVDRNGVLLATNLWTASLYANPRQVIDPHDAVQRLLTVLPDLDPEKTFKTLTSDRSFVWIRRKLTPKQQYDINRLGIPGLEFQREEQRVYPHGRLVAHVVGYTDIDNRGISGLENSFDDILRSYHEPLKLSIDLRVQYILHDALTAAVEEFKALGGCGIVFDVETGEIVALVSLPDFDPHSAGAMSPEARFNRATLGIYEMGSTFKLFTVAMALDSGVVGLDGGYDATHPLRVARYTITDYRPKARWLSVPEILIYSSNIGAAKMARDVGSAGQRTFLDRLGMLRPALIELPEVGRPLIPSPWRDINTLTIAYGHGLAISPLQLVAGVATLVNGGVLYQPTLLKQDADAVGAGDRVLNPNTSAQMRHLMRLVVERGTGRNAQVPGYLIGGKTGTAEKLGKDGRYKRNALMSSFVGAFPIDAPRYALVVSVDEPIGNKRTYGYATGGWVAAPVIGTVIAGMAPLMGIEPVAQPTPDERSAPLIKVRAQGR